MAITLPETIRSSATAGERLLFRTLKQFLPDDYIVYFEPDIHGRKPDFVIVGPDLGVIILEVKDYTQSTLVHLTKDEWTIFSCDGKQAKVKNPLHQAREYAFHVIDFLKKDKALVQLEGKYQFHLKFPIGYGVVFTRLEESFLVTKGIYDQVIPPHQCLTRGEIDSDKETFSEEYLMEKLLNMFTVPFRLREPLTLDDINAIRFHLFPEVRISGEFRPAPYREQLLLSLHDMKTMDLHQETLAKQLGDKNRLIRGVAGSGKTLILACRARMLRQQYPDWRILVLCYNISLANGIRQMIEKAGVTGVDVRNFHAWLKNDLRVTEAQLPQVVAELKDGTRIMPKYDAILIDEGQDFATEWLQLVSALLNEETQSLLLVEDRAQSIYKRKRSYVQDLGFSFQGRSKVLTINYRNTEQIVRFAWEFYQANSLLKTKVHDTETDIIIPQSSRRRGPEPLIIAARSFRDELQQVIAAMKRLHADKAVPYAEMLVLYRVKKSRSGPIIDPLMRALQAENLPYYWLTENDVSKRNYKRDEQSIKISTIDSSKGLDFQAVFIINLENMPFALEDDVQREVSLLYIGMTRATTYLTLSFSGESLFTRYFQAKKQGELVTVKTSTT